MGRKETKILYYADLVDDFTNHVELENEENEDLKEAKNKDWKMLGEIIKGIKGYNDDFALSSVDYEIHDLITVLCGNESVNFKDAMAIHTPCLYYNEYRLDFDRWALRTVRDFELKFQRNEIFIGESWMNCEKEILAMTQEKNDAYKTDTQDVLIVFICDLSRKYYDFVAYQPFTELYETVYDYIRFTFPEFHVHLVRKFIKEGYEYYLTRGLKPVPKPQKEENPTEETENPTDETENPTEETESPTEETENPTEEKESPTEESESPTKETENPTEASENPTEETENPDETQEKEGGPKRNTKNSQGVGKESGIPGISA